MKTFRSPQTGSEYTVLADLPGATVSYRVLEDDVYRRVRFQSPDAEGLEALLDALQAKELGFDWGATLRPEDTVRHISTVTSDEAEVPRLVGHLVANWLRVTEGEWGRDFGAYYGPEDEGPGHQNEDLGRQDDEDEDKEDEDF